jgi:hypothetical protein
LVAIGSISLVVFVLILLLTMFGSWRVAVAFELLFPVGAILIWRRRILSSWTRYVYSGALVASALFSAVVLMPTWTSEARHDGRLGEMADQLCSIELRRGASVDGCGGSISNTGNGNSCQYLASATVTVPAGANVIGNLEEQGFRRTRLDPWGDPGADGRTYVIGEDKELHVFLQYSWQDDEDDLRCT